MSPSSPVRVTPVPDVPRTTTGAVDLGRVVASLRPLGPVHLLESVSGSAGARPWSIVAPAPRAWLGADEHGTWLRTGTGVEPLDDDPFAAIDACCTEWELTPDASPPDGPPFSGGLVGALSYDLARRIERVPSVAAADRTDLLAHLVVAEVAVGVRDDEAVLVERALLDDHGPAGLAEAVRDRLRDPSPAPRDDPPPRGVPVTTTLGRDAYIAAVEAALAHIAAGDVFQLNITQRLTCPWEHDVHALYRALRRESPAPHGAVIELPDGSGIASVSPETFLAASGRHVRTRPIKGTRPRGDDPESDRRLRDELTGSPKDRAENVMIVDLERNDLGRVCEVGSVRVDALVEPEAHPHVWHLVSTISGELAPDVGWGGLLGATFPSGSVTGTPKVRALELIEELEPVRRGWYCGAIGYLSAGHADLSVAIRTATCDPGGTVDYGAGGGVVADSDPVAEHVESVAKAAAFLAATGARLPPAPVDSRRTAAWRPT